MFKLSQGPVQFLGLFLAAEQKNSFWNGPDFGTILVLFFGPGTRPGNDFLPLARWPCSASWAWKNAFCGWVQMKQVLAVRVGAKKAVGHIVSKKWWPTVGGLGSEARFQVKKSACFWCHGRYHEWWVFSPKLKPIHHASIHAVHFCEFSYSSSYGPISRPCFL